MDADDSAEDCPEGTDAVSTYPGPGELTAFAKHRLTDECRVARQVPVR